MIKMIGWISVQLKGDALQRAGGWWRRCEEECRDSPIYQSDQQQLIARCQQTRGQNWFVINTLTLSHHQPSPASFISDFRFFSLVTMVTVYRERAIAWSTQHTRVPASIAPSRHTTGASVNTQDDGAHVIAF